jgi:hypothetical protein
MKITTDSNQTPHAVTVSKLKGRNETISAGRERVAYGEARDDDEGAGTRPRSAAAGGGARTVRGVRRGLDQWLPDPDIKFSGGTSSLNLNFSLIFFFKYKWIRLNFKKLSWGCHSAVYSYLDFHETDKDGESHGNCG